MDTNSNFKFGMAVLLDDLYETFEFEAAILSSRADKLTSLFSASAPGTFIRQNTVY